MRIQDYGEKPKDPLMGYFRGVSILDAAIMKQEEVICLSEKHFRDLNGIIKGFLDLGRNNIPNLDKDVNDLLKSKGSEIRFIGIAETGFYWYKIKHGGVDVYFGIEPNLIPIYNYVINDMMRRHRQSPHPSYVSNDGKEIESPLIDINEAVKNISAQIKSVVKKPESEGLNVGPDKVQE
jgi:hypothetical protein